MRIAPAVAGNDKPLRHDSLRVGRDIQTDFPEIRQELDCLLLSGGNQKFFYILLISALIAQTAVEGLLLLLRLGEDPDEIAVVKDPHSLRPGALGEIGEMIQIPAGTQRRADFRRNNRNGIRQPVFSLIGENPEASLDLVAHFKRGGVNPVQDHILCPRKPLADDRHAQSGGGDLSLYDLTRRAADGEGALPGLPGRDFYADLLFRKRERLIDRVKLFAVHIILFHKKYPLREFKSPYRGYYTMD